VVGFPALHKNGQELGFSLNNAAGGQEMCIRWMWQPEKWNGGRTSETGREDGCFPGSGASAMEKFDGKMISGFLYKPPAKFTGKRPVLVDIHGGPEGQSQPRFSGTQQLFAERTGDRADYRTCAVRPGTAKTFSLLDNGFKREDTYKDINALVRFGSRRSRDWIASGSR